MLLNKKVVRKNKSLKIVQKQDKKANYVKKIDRESPLRKNIYKVVRLASNGVVGEECYENNIFQSGINYSDLIDKVEKAELTGMSGNGYPVAKKLREFKDSIRKSKIIIINAVECDPTLLHDRWLLSNKSKEISIGASYLTEAFSPARIILAYRGNINIKIENNQKTLENVRVPYKYPMGEERVLANQLLNVSIAPQEYPINHGILVINVQTVYQIGRIINDSYDGGHFITLADIQNGNACVAFVNKETNINNLLHKTFPNAENDIYAGGGVMNSQRVKQQDTFVQNMSFAGFARDSQITNENSCKKCGGCTKNCPAGIDVKQIVLAKEKDANSVISKQIIEKCIHCKTCTYFCRAAKDPEEYMLVK